MQRRVLLLAAEVAIDYNPVVKREISVDFQAAGAVFNRPIGGLATALDRRRRPGRDAAAELAGVTQLGVGGLGPL